MKRVITLLILIACMSGCSLDKAFVKSANDYAEVILPEYRSYIKADTTLDEDSKRIRMQSADKFQELLDDAMKEASDE